VDREGSRLNTSNSESQTSKRWQRVLEPSLPSDPSDNALRFVVAILAAVAALLLRKALSPFLGAHNPYHLAWLAVVFSAWYCGLWQSVIALAIETFGVWYWFLPPHRSWRVADASDWYGLLLFVLVGLLFATSGESYRRTLSRKIEAEQRAHRARKLFESFMENSPVLSYLKDENGKYVYSNNASRTGTIADVIGKTDFDLFPRAIAEQKREHDLIVLKENKAHEFVENTIETDGEHTWLTVKFPVIDTDGRRLLAGKAIDITERKRAEDAIAKSRDELEQRVEERTAAARELSARLLAMQDEERRRIARELHDSAGQMIAALIMNVHQLKTSDAQEIERVRLLSDSSAMLETLNKEVRTISHLLHPPLLDEVGLSSALQWYVDEFAKRSGIATRLELETGFGRANPDLEIAIFRIVQECLTNVHRHSGSSKAMIRLRRSNGSILLEIQDDGKGIAAEKKSLILGSGPVGVGLRGMRERVLQLGGSLEIESENTGTTVQAIFPVAKSATLSTEVVA
jgi:PAS domain S-box-containing protein